ncbi:Cation-transporting P-type ATPase B [Frankliniella fusca]|uniref:Cation-transporting P-type ATPase B n=1 Tax=Frankliniella fusca TaxID=407009 RepID=A0AAE1H7P9_9NEOP|nr:Cation-transporting P-type ATPase B [Frankliniella fusca]
MNCRTLGSATRVYTPGKPFLAQPSPQDTMPTCLTTSPTLETSGPPESPWHESLPTSRLSNNVEVDFARALEVPVSVGVVEQDPLLLQEGHELRAVEVPASVGVVEQDPLLLHEGHELRALEVPVSVWAWWTFSMRAMSSARWKCSSLSALKWHWALGGCNEDVTKSTEFMNNPSWFTRKKNDVHSIALAGLDFYIENEETLDKNEWELQRLLLGVPMGMGAEPRDGIGNQKHMCNKCWVGPQLLDWSTNVGLASIMHVGLLRLYCPTRAGIVYASRKALVVKSVVRKLSACFRPIMTRANRAVMSCRGEAFLVGGGGGGAVQCPMLAMAVLHECDEDRGMKATFGIARQQRGGGCGAQWGEN